MSVHVLLNFLNEFRKRDKMRGFTSILSLFATNLINPIIQEHDLLSSLVKPVLSSG